MSRSVNHPDVRAVVRALDRAAESNRIHPSGVMGITASIIFERRDNCERFCNWNEEIARAITIAYALACPARELREMAAIAREETKHLDDWDRFGWYEMYGFDRPRSNRKRAELDRQIAEDDAASAKRRRAA